jgi:hypothetical protein
MGWTGQGLSEAGGVMTIRNTDNLTDPPFANAGRDEGFHRHLNVDGVGSALNITQSSDAAAGVLDSRKAGY